MRFIISEIALKTWTGFTIAQKPVCRTFLQGTTRRVQNAQIESIRRVSETSYIVTGTRQDYRETSCTWLQLLILNPNHLQCMPRSILFFWEYKFVNIFSKRLFSTGIVKGCTTSSTHFIYIFFLVSNCTLWIYIFPLRILNS